MCQKSYFLRVDGQIVEERQQFPIGAFGARRVRIEQMSLFQRRGNDTERAFPRAMQKVESPVDFLPMRQMEERVTNRLRIAALQNVLRREDQRLHFEKISETRRKQ